MVSGIYQIVCTATGCVYIGSSKDVSHRVSTHRSYLRKGRHINVHLQNAWIKYGEGAFGFSVLTECPVEELIYNEQSILDAKRLSGSVFNVAECVDCPSRGRPHTPEHRAKISAALMGKRASCETRAKLSASHVGKTLSADARAKVSAALRVRKRSPEACARISAAKKGKRFTPEHCASMAAARQGKKASAETRAKMSAAQRSRRADERFRA